MCYPKPGPRCSSHALKALEQAHVTLAHLESDLDYEENPSSQLLKDYYNAKQALQQAEWEYYKTPDGQKAIDLALVAGRTRYGHSRLSDIEKVQLEETKKRAWAERLEDIQALKVSGNDDLHAGETLVDWDSELQEADNIRHGWSALKNNEQHIESYRQRSGAWVQSLDEEDKKRLAFWSSPQGLRSVKNYLTEGTIPSSHMLQREDVVRVPVDSPQGIEEFCRSMDGLTQHPFSGEDGEGAVVYRGVNMQILPGQLQTNAYTRSSSSDRAAIDHLKKTYPVGSVHNVPFYQSASLDPNVADRFSDSSKIMFEIRAKRGAMVGGFSMYNDEAEVLLPRNTSLRVVGVQERVPYQIGDQIDRDVRGRLKHYTVIQFEQVDTIDDGKG